MKATTPGADERAAFEAEVRKINSRENLLERWPDGSYKHHGTEGRWKGWQMARAAAPQPTDITKDAQ